MDTNEIIDKYLNNEDWKVKENSTVPYSIGGLILYESGKMTSNYWLKKIYNEKIEFAHNDGYIHIHDLTMLAPYCAGWSLKQLICFGIKGVEGKITSGPAKHLQTL